METVLKVINHYIYAGWEQLPFLFGATLANVASGIVRAGSFSWQIFSNKMKEKGIYYGLSLLALHFICFIPFNGKSLYESTIQIPLIDFNLNVFGTLNSAAVIYMAVYELLSTDDNLHEKFDRRFIPPSVGDPLRKWLYPARTATT